MAKRISRQILTPFIGYLIYAEKPAFIFFSKSYLKQKIVLLL